MKPEQLKSPNPDDVLRKMLSTPPEPHKQPAKPAPKKGVKAAALHK
jgi:hypothetical protein